MFKCFVIQPFDTQDTRRFDDDLAPAITQGGFEAVRGDRVVGISSDLIKSTHHHIQESAVCLADITREDKPNVWYEVGYAIALKKPVLMIRENNGLPNPFDVSLHKTLYYSKESSGDFAKLREQIIAELKTLLATIPQISPQPASPSLRYPLKAQLDDVEIMILLLMMNGDIDAFSPVTYATIQRVLVTEKGNTMLSVNLAIRDLKRKGLIASFKWGGADALLITPAWEAWARNHPGDVERLKSESGV